MQTLFYVVFNEEFGEVQVMLDDAVRGHLTAEDEAKMISLVNDIVNVVGERLKQS